MRMSTAIMWIQIVGGRVMSDKMKHLNGVHLPGTFLSSMWPLTRNSCNKVFVGGLSYDTNETIIRDTFMQHGEIIEVRVICDHVSGKSKGYGFVKFASETAATSALEGMNGQELDGRKIHVYYAFVEAGECSIPFGFLENSVGDVYCSTTG
ncbi:hypothetical protein Nepgr_009274 [Nepenthes gracilis]|uniref:RRM domain-containing protein n=1 Tax=Nepenthes gracilis TaxID=150966 RepID=A0AAD3SB73_NEPGR|nr:hypothetical protein Nepgr_009274 [Nepenthes gracilis]